MDKIINSHIDKIEALQEEFMSDLDSIIKDIDIADIIDNAEFTMSIIKDDILELYREKYALRAAELGIDFAEMIQKKIDADKTIKIDDSKNPNLNKDEKTD